MKKKCWICTGTGNSICRMHNHARQERMAKYNIDSDTAIWQLRQDELILEETTRQFAGAGLRDENGRGTETE